jgi:hypothetical protein
MLSLLAGPSPATAGESLTLEGLKDALRLTPEEIDALRNGEILQRSSEETSRKELSLTLVVVLSHPHDDVIRGIRDEISLRADASVIAFRELPEGEPRAEDFKEAVFGPDDGDEIRALADVKPGSAFNLSAEEIAGFQALRREHPGPCDREPGCTAAFNRAWSTMLLERMKAYRACGLAGIADYDRGGDVARPAEELRGALEALEPFGRQMPAFYRAVLDYPRSPLAGIETSFYWRKGKVQKRPTFSLAHRMALETSEGYIAVERTFYVQRSFNSLQRAAAVFPLDGTRTICFYNGRTSTDQVDGFGSAMRHSIGRRMMFDRLRNNVEDLRKQLDAEATATSTP